MEINKENQWIDVSATISDGMAHWPTDAPVHVYKTDSIENGAAANVTAISSTAHVGTHVDAPLHFFDNGEDVADIDLGILIGPAKVFWIQDNTSITLNEIRGFDINQYDRVLFRTRNSDVEWERLPFMDNYVYLGKDAAQYLVDKGVRCIGIDYLSLGSKENDIDVHRMVLGVPIIIIEGLKLGNIASGDYDMVCLPLKIKGSDGGPARVILKKRR